MILKRCPRRITKKPKDGDQSATPHSSSSSPYPTSSAHPTPEEIIQYVKIMTSRWGRQVRTGHWHQHHDNNERRKSEHKSNHPRGGRPQDPLL